MQPRQLRACQGALRDTVTGGSYTVKRHVPCLEHTVLNHGFNIVGLSHPHGVICPLVLAMC